MDRPDISRLNKNRSIYLKLGFIISLGLTVMAFNYTVYDDFNKDYVAEREEVEKDILEEVQRTVHKEKKLPPPPVLKPTDNFVEDDVIFDPEPKPEPIKEPVILNPGPPEPSPVTAPSEPPKPVFKPKEREEKVPDLFLIVEEMPRFPGCDENAMTETELKACSDKAMLDFIYKEVRYPALAKENNIEGTVVLSFVVEKDGSISSMKVLREIGGGCGAEVMRVVKKMPIWIPGRQQGRNVRVQFNLPVKFKLK